ncbi:hypothetical protein BD560DRAFT_324491 [Blakeslea trispora]|nr:hypothetical protein BD560DRAFT_324491 [Blakeslea trispora]
MTNKSTETIKNVMVGSSLAAIVGGTTGATFAVLKNAPVKQWTISTSLNCGVFGATFFCKGFFSIHKKTID